MNEESKLIELFKKYPGIAARIRRSFAYHYDQIQREIEDQYDYFLDCWSGDDEYQYLYDYYENKYPEYNQELKHYGK